mmetsp:Transcript_76412/g.212261  ORF Transcript_76412/g.212261 Transcript_76412/m.212261 type:complete len:377 (+) Transcript_76412:137-1267(+)
MVEQILDMLPPDPMEAMIKWLRTRRGIPHSTSPTLAEINKALRHELQTLQDFVQEAAAAGCASSATAAADSEEEDEDDEEEIDLPLPPPQSRGPRQSVSAEAYGAWNPQKVFEPPVHEKTEEQKLRLQRILSECFLFARLEAKDLDIVSLAMQRVEFAASSRIITEGADGEHLFVIEEGSPVCKKLVDGAEQVVKQCVPGDVFGELALLYNAPRAATVNATDRCVAWRLDRETFNHILRDSATKRLTLREGFLANVTILMSLEPYERMQLADLLQTETFKMNDFVIEQGSDLANRFYIVEQGTLVAQKSVEGGEPTDVMTYGPGDYFGELGLLRDQPRAAGVVVTSEAATLLSLDRKSFTKVLGPLRDIMNQRIYS